MLLRKVKENKTFELMVKAYKPISGFPDVESWGLGVRVITDEKHEYLPVGAFGWSGAYGTHFWCDPENNITAVYMKNSKVDGGGYNQSACHFEKAVYDACGMENITFMPSET